MNIETALNELAQGELKSGALALLESLGLESRRSEELPSNDAAGFARAFGHSFSKNAHTEHWRRVELLFQITGDEVGGQLRLGENPFEPERFQSFLFFAIELRDESYARGVLASIAREINTPFPAPVIVLFRHGQTVSVASLHRRENLNNANRDVLERVVLLKDIRCHCPHGAHLKILRELGEARNRARDWAEFLNEWNRVLDISKLNREFYRELSNWFFAAREAAKFPDTSENAIERGLIRLITRLVFTWFIKERGLVPGALFETARIETLLRNSDGESGTYYRAVLQNLFFATLNTEMEGRRFRRRGGGAHGQAGDYGLSCYFRYEDEFRAPAQWLELVREVPFLNGGLFECLDPEDRDGARIDGFSDVAARQAHLPNKLFWGEPLVCDLSAVYDDARQKAVRVTPILNLLHLYKFTIDENTPLEEDVALDPELLGKVFENLLASYNPETRTTARKQTGSFYTPREIVNYMVEEALAAYLETHVGAWRAMPARAAPASNAPASNAPASNAPASNAPATNAPASNAPATYLGMARHAPTGKDVGVTSTVEIDRTLLRTLLSDSDARTAAELGFAERDIENLVGAIERCTILDPACGSGAFPMGALAKMVALLHKLDPHNNLWRAAQLRAVAARLAQSGAAEDARAQAESETRAIFEENDDNYARKLFLIERCLFGVDIQPVALQIAKLRCFIALIIDQKIDDLKPNRNIRALPNLETRFVAANTLIALPQTGAITPEELKPLEAELARVRREHIAPKSRARKKELEKHDARLRGEIETLMHEAGFGDSFVSPLVAWNPYDQNAVAPFFEPERMFGPELKDGFDIVIGNPPYIHGKSGIFNDADKKYYRDKYVTAEYQMDTYILFTERSGMLASKEGVVCLIIPNTWLSNIRLEKIRKFLLQSFEFKSITTLPPDIFSQAVVDTLVLIVKKDSTSQDLIPTGVLKGAVYERTIDLSRRETLSHPGHVLDVNSGKGTNAIMSKIENNSIAIAQIALINRGTHAYRKDGFGQTKFGSGFQTERDYVERSYHATRKLDSTYYPEIRGKHVSPYRLEKTDTFVSWGNWLAEPRSFSFFENERIYLRKIVGNTLYAQLVTETNIADQSVYIAKITNSNFSVKFVLGILNSRITAWYFRNKNNEFDALFPQIKVTEFKKLPIPTATPAQQQAIASRVEMILSAKAEDRGADTSSTEREIDVLVADLYGLDEAERALVGIV